MNKKNKYLSETRCKECGEFISQARLKALPKSKICINCAEKKESKGSFKKSHLEINTSGISQDDLETESVLIKGD